MAFGSKLKTDHITAPSVCGRISEHSNGQTGSESYGMLSQTTAGYHDANGSK